jgi:hypothetical protein
MILMLHGKGAIELMQAEDFGRFHIEIDAGFDSLAQAAGQLAPLAQIESREVAWVDRDALFSLGCAQAGDAAAWTSQAQAMLDKAARYGWVRERSPTIKSHIVWRT